MSVHFQFPCGRMRLHPADRAAIEDHIEQLLYMLDQDDGDCDIEEDDPSYDPLEDNEALGFEPLPTLPIYAVDQSLSPVNQRECKRIRDAALYGANPA